MTQHTVWNTNFENTPADNDLLSQGAARIRHLKEATREILEAEHHFIADVETGDAPSGYHKRLTLYDADLEKFTRLYNKIDGDELCLYLVKSDGTEINLTPREIVLIGNSPEIDFNESSVFAWRLDGIGPFVVRNPVNGISGAVLSIVIQQNSFGSGVFDYEDKVVIVGDNTLPLIPDAFVILAIQYSKHFDKWIGTLGKAV